MTPEPSVYDQGGVREPLRVPVAWRTPGRPTPTITLYPVPSRPVGTAHIDIAPEIPEALRRYVASREVSPGTRVVEYTTPTGQIDTAAADGGISLALRKMADLIEADFKGKSPDG